MGNPKDDAVDLDKILVEEIGQFGKYQLMTILLVAVPVMFSAFSAGEYIFTAGALPHRCRIAHCDAPEPQYEPAWLGVAVPGTPGSYDQCNKFVSLVDAPANVSGDTCPAAYFDRSRTVDCAEYVYERTNTVVYDFGLECQEWRRTLIGTFSTIGTLLVLPITGYISDRFGRRVALVLNAFNTGAIGLIRSWANSYELFLGLELVESTIGAGAYSSAFILSTELVGPKWRVLAGAVMSTFFATGQVVLGFIAWGVPEWRTLTRVLYIPQLVVIVYFWILYESVRWLLSKGKYEKAEEILLKAAKINGKEISQKSLEGLRSSAEAEKSKEKETTTDLPQENIVKKIWKSPVMLRRICTTPVWWVTTTLVYYGLSINSVALAGTIHFNYILVAAVEIPGYWTAIYVLDKIGRKITLCAGYMTCSLTMLLFVLIGSDIRWVSLLLYLLGKYSISMVFTSIYVYTAELYPTQHRHSLLAFSSMIGRIGSITAPLTPALMIYWEPMPSVIFGVMALISGILVLTTPETLNSKLPDTFEDAEAIGRKKTEVA